jgi:ribosomal protein S18 acetylase RimI-like enzyme
MKKSGSSNQFRLLTLADLKRAVYVLARAFQDDPLFKYLVPDIRKRQYVLEIFFSIFLKFSIQNFKAYGVSKPIDGVAIWSFPNLKGMYLSGLFGIDLLKLVFSRMTFSFFKMLNIFSKSEKMRKKYAPKPHYYLEAIAVLPKFQGKGLASKLIKPFLKKADKELVGIYTETMKASNVTLYEHFGFQCIEKYQLPNTDVNLWALFRSPRL